MAKKPLFSIGGEWLLAFYTGRLLEVGVEILPARAMNRDMSCVLAYSERELHNVLRHGRAGPPEPLVLFGVEP